MNNRHPEQRRENAIQTIAKVAEDVLRKSSKTSNLKLAASGGGYNVSSGESGGDAGIGFGTQFYNGAIVETIYVQIYQNGANVELSIEKEGGGDLTVRFGDESYVYDTTPPDTIQLPPGTDEVAIQYFVFLKLVGTTPTLDYLTTGWPAYPFCPVVRCNVPSASGVGVFGVYKQHSYTDHLSDANTGHLQHINEKLRVNVTHYRGTVPSSVPAIGLSDTDIFVSVTSGILSQLHLHNFPAISMPSDYVFVINDPTTLFNRVNNLNYITQDSEGVALKKYFTLVIWGVVSEHESDCKLFVNLPSGSYNTLAQGVADDALYTDYSIPNEYRGVGFLIAALTLSQTGINFTTIDLKDITAFVPSSGIGGGSIASQEFQDSLLRHQNSADVTKEAAFDVSAITAATTRTYQYPDKDGTFAMLSDIAGGAPVDAEYLTLSLNGSLTDERVLTAGEGIDLTDGGAGGNLTVSGEDASTANKGIASFETTDFNAASGAIELKDSVLRLVAGDIGGTSTPANHLVSINGRGGPTTPVGCNTAAAAGKLEINVHQEIFLNSMYKDPVVTGTVFTFVIPTSMNGMELNDVMFGVDSLSPDADAGTINVNLSINSAGTITNTVLSTDLTLAYTAYSSTNGVVDATKKTVSSGDIVRIEVVDNLTFGGGPAAPADTYSCTLTFK